MSDTTFISQNFYLQVRESNSCLLRQKGSVWTSTIRQLEQGWRSGSRKRADTERNQQFGVCTCSRRNPSGAEGMLSPCSAPCATLWRVKGTGEGSSQLPLLPGGGEQMACLFGLCGRWAQPLPRTVLHMGER